MWELAAILSVVDKIAGWGKVPSGSKRGRQALELGHKLELELEHKLELELEHKLELELELGHKLELEHRLVVVRGIHPCGV